jgi:hypothetical protein
MTIYTSNPVADAEAHEARSEAQDAAHDFVCGRIRQTLTQDVRHVETLTELTLPYWSWARDTCEHMTAPEAIGETLDASDVLKAISLVIQKSDCPHVAALREAIAQSYIKDHAHKLHPSDF